MIQTIIFYYAPEIFTIYGGEMNTYALASASIPWAIGVVCMDHLYTIGLELLRGMHDTFLPLVISSLSNRSSDVMSY
ncbi:MAG TPA: hypothetical protein VK133_04355 [Amoebophilaceae bacterium]|nr:hypothetical protein [Amoebophilaceae bacterium]